MMEVPFEGYKNKIILADPKNTLVGASIWGVSPAVIVVEVDLMSVIVGNNNDRHVTDIFFTVP